MSSASRPSEAVVKPTRSAKSTETSRRSAAGAARRRRVGGRRLPATSAVPHSPQNFAVGGFGGAARRAGERQRAAALAAELPAGLVLGAAGGAGNSRHPRSLACRSTRAKPKERYAQPMSEKRLPKPGEVADDKALSGSDEAQAHVRRWWRRVPRP